MKTDSITRKLEKYDLTAFQKRVLLQTYLIPKGETRTYKQIAQAAGRPKAYRAVGTALRLNPLAPKIPCHRVVRSNGDIGNYSAEGGKRKKLMMLRSEGAI